MVFVAEDSWRSRENPSPAIAQETKDERRQLEPDDKDAQEHRVTPSTPVSSLQAP